MNAEECDWCPGYAELQDFWVGKLSTCRGI